MRDKLETIAFYIIGVPIVLLMCIVYWTARLCGADLSEDF